MPLWIITGPTACGKGALGRCLARMINGEIVSVDSMKVYRGMDIGSSKPPLALRLVVRHWMLDVVEPWETYSLARYLREAREAIATIERCGRRPILVGGTPLYIRGLLYDIFEGPPADGAIREELHKIAVEKGPSALHDELAKVDPISARRLHPHDLRRTVRALEVYRLTGRPISQCQRQYPAPVPAREARIIVLEREAEDLRARMRRRLDRMVRLGLFEEVERLLALPRPLGQGAAQAVGYKEVIAHLQGRLSREEALDAILRNTWRLARKQMTWFRSFRSARPVFLTPEEPTSKSAQRVLELLESENWPLNEQHGESDAGARHDLHPASSCSSHEFHP